MISNNELGVFVALLALSTAGACGGGSAAVDAGGSTDAARDPDAAPGSTSLVVDAAWVLDGLGQATVQLVDVRAGGSYDAARIPGAVHVDASALRATIDGIAGQVAPPEDGATVLSAAGVLRDATVVVYGGGTDTTPARVVWTLQYYGHDRVHLLDGGWGAWQDAGYEVETTAPASDPSTYSIDALDDGVRVDIDWVLAHLDDPDVALVDARSAGEYSSGRIPGAISVDWTRNVSDGALLPRDQVAALYEGIDPAATVVTYCQTGSRAAVAYVVLRWLGFADVRLYDGSWAEWGSRDDTPKQSD